uniref:Ovule protein n=1 Tax=Heterorhabditis bacteriophora TaxID=37862 RepID=A0A1I7WBZ6_HETBA
MHQLTHASDACATPMKPWLYKITSLCNTPFQTTYFINIDLLLYYLLHNFSNFATKLHVEYNNCTSIWYIFIIFLKQTATVCIIALKKLLLL